MIRDNWRRRVVTWALGLGILVGSAIAVGDFALRPPARHFFDDIVAGFGNTQAAPDFSIGWETVDASDHHLEIAGVAGGTGDVVLNWDPNTDWGVTNANALRIQSADAAAPTEYLSARHDGTDGEVKVGSGNLNLNAASAVVAVPAGTGAGQQRMVIRGVAASTNTASVEMGEGTTSSIYMRHHSLFDEGAFIVDDTAGNMFVFKNSGSASMDCDHATTTNPTIFLHADTTCDANNALWGSFAHDQTDFQIATGTGDAIVSAAGGALELAAGTNLRRYHSCACNYNSGTANCVTGLAPDDFVIGCSLKVATVWDGNGTVDCRIDAAASNTLVTAWDNGQLIATGWMMFGSSVEGGPKDTWINLATGDDSVDCVATPGTSTQGLGTMYVIIDKMN